MNGKTIALLATGFGLSALSKSLEQHGDLAPFAKSGVHWERLLWHGTALLVLLAAGACFVVVLVRFFAKKPA